MTHYLFDTKKYADIIGSKAYIYFDEQQVQETVSSEDGNDETATVYSYRRAEATTPLDKGKIVNAIIREDYSQDAAEAIIRHKLNGDSEEWDAFNACAEAAKVRAVEILSHA